MRWPVVVAVGRGRLMWVGRGRGGRPTRPNSVFPPFARSNRVEALESKRFTLWSAPSMSRHHRFSAPLPPARCRIGKRETNRIYFRCVRYGRTGTGPTTSAGTSSTSLPHTSLRDHRDAADFLVHLRQTSPEWLRHQRKGKDILLAILRSRKRPLSQELRSLADFMDLAG